MQYTETPNFATIDTLMENADEGNYGIPYFQRKFEWEPKMVCELIESILQGYYTGLILLWKLNPEESKKEKWDPVWGVNKAKVNNPDEAILDGQQRLSALYYAIYNPNKKFPNRKSYYDFMINMNKALNNEWEDSVDYTDL